MPLAEALALLKKKRKRHSRQARARKKSREGEGSGRKYTPKYGDIVEVYWVGEGQWFEGEVVDVNDEGLYRVHYVSDGQKIWHDHSEGVRLKLD